jgi:hypothetical protein
VHYQAVCVDGARGFSCARDVTGASYLVSFGIGAALVTVAVVAFYFSALTLIGRWGSGGGMATSTLASRNPDTHALSVSAEAAGRPLRMHELVNPDTHALSVSAEAAG